MEITYDSILLNIYDENWVLYDPDTGLVNITIGAEKCAAAANPNVAEENQRQCVECLLSDVDGKLY